MRLLSVVIDGQDTPALLRGEQLLPLRAAADVKTIIARADAADWVAQQVSAAGPADWLDYASATLALPIAQPGKIICIGLNYRDHAAEGGHEIPDYPALFMRVPRSLVAAGQPLVRPQASTKFDYEAELAVIIGRPCRHVSEADALSFVFGYSVFQDGSLRDYQRKSSQWTAGKNFDRTGSFGPVIVSADELPAGASGLRITCEINGTSLQDGNTADLIFPVARAVSLISEIMTLEPGDVIATGTPAGVGFARKPPVWLKAGDRCTVSVEGIGSLTNTVVDEDLAATQSAARG